LNTVELIDWLSLVGVIAGAVSIILGLISILIAWLFYTQAKASEVRTEVVLAEIKCQTHMLNEITNSQIKTLTKAVTDQSPTEKHLLDAFTSNFLSDTNLKDNIHLKESSNTKDLKADLVSAHISLHQYTALANNANVFAIRILKHFEAKIPGNLWEHVDYTHTDFSHMKNRMGTIAADDINKSSVVHIYRDTLNVRAPDVISSKNLKDELGIS